MACVACPCRTALCRASRTICASSYAVDVGRPGIGRRPGDVDLQALADRELRGQAIERRAEIGGLPARLAQHRQVVAHLAVAAVDRLACSSSSALRHAHRIALQEQLARLDAQVDAGERLDEAVVQVARDAAALLEHGDLLRLALESDGLEARGRLADEHAAGTRGRRA